MNSKRVTIQTKAAEQYFTVQLVFIMLYKVVLTVHVQSVDEPKVDCSNESSVWVVYDSTVC